MSDVQLTVVEGDVAQVIGAIPGPQGPAGAVAAAIDGSAALPSIAFASDTDTGLYRVGANQLGVSTGGTQRLVIDETGQIEAASLGTQAAPTWTFVGDPDTGAYSPGANQFAISTNGTGRLFVDGNGNVGIGTASPAFNFVAAASATDGTWFNTSGTQARVGLGGIANSTAGAFQILYNRASGLTTFGVGTRDTPSTAFAIDSSNRLGIGTVSPGALLHVSNQDAKIRLGLDASSQYIDIYRDSATGFSVYNAAQAAIFRAHVWQLGGIEAARIRSDGTFEVKGAGTAGASPAFSVNGSAPANSAIIDSSGRLLVGAAGTTGDAFGGAGGVRSFIAIGTSASLGTHRNGADAFGNAFIFTKARGAATQAVIQDDTLGIISFQGANGSGFNFASEIRGEVDGAVTGGGANDMPGRLIFATTSDGAASPTERLRISSTGLVTIAGDTVKVATAKTPASATAAGTAGEICWDANYIYVCTATNTWKRTAIATW